MNEIWKVHPRFTEYEVSNFGRIKTNRYKSSGKIMRIQYKMSGDQKRAFVNMTLDKNSKAINVQISRAVAETFLPDFTTECVVMHLDNNPLNNRVDNLRCGTQSENILQCIRDGRYKKRRVCPVKLANITQALGNNLSRKQISDTYDYPYSTVCDIVRNISYYETSL